MVSETSQLHVSSDRTQCRNAFNLLAEDLTVIFETVIAIIYVSSGSLNTKKYQYMERNFMEKNQMNEWNCTGDVANPL